MTEQRQGTPGARTRRRLRWVYAGSLVLLFVLYVAVRWAFEPAEPWRGRLVAAAIYVALMAVIATPVLVLLHRRARDRSR